MALQLTRAIGAAGVIQIHATGAAGVIPTHATGAAGVIQIHATGAAGLYLYFYYLAADGRPQMIF